MASPASTPPRSRASHHQHSNSEPIPQINVEQERRRERLREREKERERERERERGRERGRKERERVKERERERERGGYRERRGQPRMYMSQQPLIAHSQHISSPSKRNYLSQSRHSDSHLMGMDPGQQMAFQSHHRQAPTEGHTPYRRRSADQAVVHPLDNPISPSASFPHPFPLSRGPSQSRDHPHHRQDSFGSSTEESHHMEEMGGQPLVGGATSRWPKERRVPRFEEISGDEGGCSQPRSWDPISHTDIQIRIEDEGETPFSSASTLTGASQPRGPHPYPPSLGQHSSQEQFAEEEDHTRLMDMLGGPLSSQYPYFDPYDQENVGPPQAKSEAPPHTHGLSQPTVSKRWQSSVPDLSVLTGTTSTSNLAHSQFLSQSVAEVQHHTRRGEPVGGRYTDAMVLRAAASHPTSQSYHGYLNRMPSEPHLNEGLLHPGLQRTMLARLREEEGEHSPNSWRRQRAVAYQQPPKKCYQGTRRARTKESGSPSSRPRGTRTQRVPSHEENRWACAYGAVCFLSISVTCALQL